MGIQEEISVFVSACLNGILVCAVYNALRIVRRLIPHSLFWVSAEDLFYWIWCGIYIFSEIQRTCSGRIRWFYMIGIALGCVSFGILVSNFLKKRIDKSKKTR